MQIVAYGAQDLYLTGNPQVTFFKSIYRRYTNFAIESIQQTFNGTVDFGKKVSTQISRNGDLIWKIYLEVTLPTLTSTGTAAWTRRVGEVMIDYVEIQIGGQTIDKHYGQFLTLWQELTQPAELADTYNVMIGNTSALTTEAASVTGGELYIPLQFWFCKSPGLALPLIALQYHEVVINVQFRPFSECYVSASGVVTTPTLTDASLWVDYIYLDTDERRQFAQIPHEYLIDQLQFTGATTNASTSIRSQLNFNHPTKELIFVAQLATNTASGANRWTDFTDNGVGASPYGGSDFLVNAKLQLNGQDRFATRLCGYFNLVQPYQHHTRGPSTGIYVYSFALKPEEQQPNGTCNFSRIDNATLQLTMASSASFNLFVYAVNFNILRVMSGIREQINFLISLFLTCSQQLAAIKFHEKLDWVNSGIHGRSLVECI